MKRVKESYKLNVKYFLKLKIIGLILLLILVLGIMVSTIYLNVLRVEAVSDSYKEKLIRFHVLANSDSQKDQELKLKVRDAVIDYLQPKLIESDSVSESENIILEQKEQIVDLCEDVIKENGYNYRVSVDLKYSDFPAKKYSSVVLPAGKYKALKIVIGNGAGKNWWCVMFPPLCFVDDENSVIDKETDEKLREVLTEEEYKLIIEKDNNKIDNLKIKFKIVEIFEKIINKKEKLKWTGVVKL